MRSTWSSKWKVGMQAPAFSSLLHDGSTITSQELSGKKYILFFYNHDGSETCTKEACNIRDNFRQLQDKGYHIYGISEDSPKKHVKFISKFNIPYPLISDNENELAKTFDLYGQKEFMGRTSDAVHRTTFVINEKGIIEAIVHPVDSANHTQQIISALEGS